MLIHEVTQLTGLTKKAIAYYISQGLLAPAVLENGYRDFCNRDLEHLNRISVLRRLGLGLEQIRAVLADESGDLLKRICLQKEQNAKQAQAQQLLLEQLSCGEPYEKIAAELLGIEQTAAISDRLLDAFPGYYGHFVCLHFSRFLSDPIVSKEQQEAYQTIVTFLDNMTPLQIPKDLLEFYSEITKQYDLHHTKQMLERMDAVYRDPDSFFTENKTTLEDYMAYKQSDDYKRSPLCKLQTLLRGFHEASGYYDVLIPAMKQVSPSYARYYANMEQANQRLLEIYPFLDAGPEAQ